MVTIFNYNVHYPNLYAFGQEITEKKNYGKVNSYLEVQGQSTSILSGAFAAVLLQGTEGKMFNLMGLRLILPFEIEAWTLQDIFLLDASTYVLAIALIWFIRYQPITIKKPDTARISERIKTGFRFLKSNPLLFVFGTTSYNIFVVLLVSVHMLMPLYVNNNLGAGADVYASAEIYYALGALGAGIGIRWIFGSMNSVKAVIIMMLVTVGIMFTCTFTKNILTFYVVLWLLGITNAGTRILRVTYLFNHIPNFIIGRSTSVFGVINILMRSLLIGLFSLPFFTSGNNVIYSYFICGLFVLISATVLLFNLKKLINLREEEIIVPNQAA